MSLQTSRHGMQHAYVVYDAATGEIRHVHQVVVLQGAEAPAEYEIEARAKALATKFGQHGPTRLKVLGVAPESLKPGMTHKVDLKSLKLISKPIPRKREAPAEPPSRPRATRVRRTGASRTRRR